MRKICIITGTRAEYGLLRWLMQEIKDDPNLTLQIIATGMHLSPEFGLTYREIEADGFQIDCKVEMLVSSDTPVGIAKSMGLGLIGFADALNSLMPDLVVVLGDRFEIFSVAAAALVARMPLAHIHGGEATEGLIDEAIRHSITKMSHFHFVAAEEYRQRVIQLGEQPGNVFLVGGLGIDGIKRQKLLSRKEVENRLAFKLGEKSLLVTFHPVTLEAESAASQIEELLAALDELRDTQLIFTMPNADTESRAIIEMINKFISEHPNARAYASLGQSLYFSCVSHVDGVIGNSSSGLLEVPSFKKPTIDIGDRQRGRLHAKSVVGCAPNRKAISDAIKKIYSADFHEILKKVENPYGEGGASAAIVKLLKTLPLEGVIVKSFYDCNKK